MEVTQKSGWVLTTGQRAAENWGHDESMLSPGFISETGWGGESLGATEDQVDFA